VVVVVEWLRWTGDEVLVGRFVVRVEVRVVVVVMAYFGRGLVGDGVGFPPRGGYLGGIGEEVARPGDGGRGAEGAGEFGDGGGEA
jgi:hypothetical protein